MRHRWLSALLLLGLLTMLPASAEARLTQEYTYSYDQTWRAAIRMIAVDLRFPIAERDPDIGYLLFSYRDNGRDYHGSLELVRAEGRNGTPIVRVVVQVPQMPTYVERMMLDRLRRKLTGDYGQPPPTRRPASPPPEADDDEDTPEDGAETPGEPE